VVLVVLVVIVVLSFAGSFMVKSFLSSSHTEDDVTAVHHHQHHNRHYYVHKRSNSVFVGFRHAVESPHGSFLTWQGRIFSHVPLATDSGLLAGCEALTPITTYGDNRRWMSCYLARGSLRLAVTNLLLSNVHSAFFALHLPASKHTVVHFDIARAFLKPFYGNYCLLSAFEGHSPRRLLAAY
jgi:hypothetical protein